jgi:hypothetical protein
VSTVYTYEDRVFLDFGGIHTFFRYTSGLWLPPVLKAIMASLKRQALEIQQILPAARSLRHEGTTNSSEAPPVASSPVDDPYAKHMRFVDQHKRGTAIWNAEWEVVWFRSLCCSKRGSACVCRRDKGL